MLPFKNLLSYLIDIPLEEKSTTHNPSLKLYLAKGQLKLITKGAVYSYGNLYYNFRESFERLHISKKQINSVLVLGLGTGSVIQLLEQKCRLNASYDIVEIDPEVVSLFEKYKSDYIQAPCHITVADALSYMSKNQKKYELICMDIFNDCTVPVNFETEEFLTNLRNALSEHGVLLYNRLSIDVADQTKNEAFYETFRRIFMKSKIIKMEFNWMFVAE